MMRIAIFLCCLPLALAACESNDPAPAGPMNVTAAEWQKGESDGRVPRCLAAAGIADADQFEYRIDSASGQGALVPVVPGARINENERRAFEKCFSGEGK